MLCALLNFRNIWSRIRKKRKDFLNKMSIAYKEARETGYWLRLLKDSDILSENHFSSIYQDLEEIIKILTKIQKTTRNKISNS